MGCIELPCTETANGVESTMSRFSVDDMMVFVSFSVLAPVPSKSTVTVSPRYTFGDMSAALSRIISMGFFTARIFPDAPVVEKEPTIWTLEMGEGRTLREDPVVSIVKTC